METNKYSKEDKYIRAKKKVEDIKGFYWHLGIYVLVNTFITAIKLFKGIRDGETFSEAFWDLGTFFVWIPWGIGLAVHGLVVFQTVPFIFGKDWEERKMKELMEEEKKHYKSFNE